MLPHLPSYAISVPVSITEVPSFNLLHSSPEEEIDFISSYAYTPPMSHSHTCLVPRVLEKVALGQFSTVRATTVQRQELLTQTAAKHCPSAGWS